MAGAWKWVWDLSWGMTRFCEETDLRKFGPGVRSGIDYKCDWNVVNTWMLYLVLSGVMWTQWNSQWHDETTILKNILPSSLSPTSINMSKYHSVVVIKWQLSQCPNFFILSVQIKLFFPWALNFISTVPSKLNFIISVLW